MELRHKSINLQIKPIQQPSLHLFDFNYYTFSHKVFNLAFFILEHAEIPKQERAAYEKLVKKMKQAAKCRPEDESDEQDQREGKDEITAFLNTRSPFPQSKERGQLYKFLTLREQKEKDTKSFLENIHKINLRVVPKQKKIEYSQACVQTGITWVRKLESIQNSQPIQQLKEQLFGKKEMRIKINVDEQKESKKQISKTLQSKKTISDKGSSKKIEKNKKNETKKMNKSPKGQDGQRINIASEHGSGNKSKTIIRKHKMGKKQNKSEADELNKDTSFTSKLYKQNDQISANKEKLIDTVQKSAQQIELESEESQSVESEQQKYIYRQQSQLKLRTQRKSLTKLEKDQQIGRQKQRKSRQIIYFEQSKVDDQKPRDVKQIKQESTLERNQEEELKQFQTYNKNRSNSNYIDNTFYNDRILQKNSNLSNLSTHTHTHGLYSDKSTMKQRLPYIKDNIKNKEKKEKQRMVERYLRNSGFRNENMTSYYEDSKQKGEKEKENKENKENKQKENKEIKEIKQKKVKKQNQMSQLGEIQNSDMHRGLQSIKERMKSLLNQKIIKKSQLNQNDKYVMNTLQKLRNQKTTNSYLDANEIREINQTNQSRINPMYNQKINQCIKLMENIHQKACGKPGCKHLQRFFEFVKVLRFQNKKSIKLPTYNIGIVPALNSK